MVEINMICYHSNKPSSSVITAISAQKIIPQDNLLRRINDLVDFSFIEKELIDKYCQDNGRMAESPVMMFKYLLLKTIYDISDVDVVERSRYDMSFKYFLGKTPENTDIINPGSLCKFRKLRLKDKDLLNLLIGKTVEIAIEKGIIRSRTIITRVRDNELLTAVPQRDIEYQAARSDRLIFLSRCCLSPEDELPV